MANPAAEARAKAQTKWLGATVAERGRKFIRHQHPSEPNRFMLDAFIGPIHYGVSEDQEIDTAWQATGGGFWDWESVNNDFHCFVRDSVPVSYRYEDVATGHFVELEFNAIEWINDEGDTEAAASFVQVTPTIDDDEIKWTNIAPGWSVRVQAQTARLAKWIDIDSLANLGSPTIGGTNEALSFDIRFTKSSGLDVYIDGVLWDEKANNPQLTAAAIEFRDGTSGEPVFWFNTPLGFDAESDNPNAPMSFHVRKQGANLLVRVNTPWTWLQTAAYPISLDATVDEQVAASSDDASELGGAVDPTDAVVRINESTDYCGARWSVAIAKDSTVSNATVDYYIANNSRKNMDCDHLVEDADSAAVYTTAANSISTRSYQTAVGDNDGIMGSTAPFWVSDDHTLVDLSTPVEATLARSGWSSGNYLAVVITENPSSNLEVDMYDSSSTLAPKLHVEYTAPGVGGTILPQVMQHYYG